MLSPAFPYHGRTLPLVIFLKFLLLFRIVFLAICIRTNFTERDRLDETRKPGSRNTVGVKLPETTPVPFTCLS